MKKSYYIAIFTIVIIALIPYLYTVFARAYYKDAYLGKMTGSYDDAFNCSEKCGWQRINDTTLRLYGPIRPYPSKSSPEYFKSLLTEKSKKIILSSGGGDGESGIILGNLIKDHNLDTEVDGFCLSACANYLFPAGKIKTINGVLGYHGGAISILKDETEKIKNQRNNRLSEIDISNIKTLQEKEHELGLRTGLSDDLIILSGRRDKGGFDDLTRNMYMPTKSELERFGLKNIINDQNEEILCGIQKNYIINMFSPEESIRNRVFYSKLLECEKYSWY
jgi:hypothetical protein